MSPRCELEASKSALAGASQGFGVQGSGASDPKGPKDTIIRHSGLG